MASRVGYIDSSRGILLALMALDHVRSFVHKSHPSEYWSIGLPVFQGDSIAFASRLVTHFCAPGFFMLMGVSMMLFASKSGNSKRSLTKHFLIRGGILILLQHFLINVAWGIASLSYDVPRESYGVLSPPGESGATYAYFGVLSSLGICMVLCSFLMHLRPIWIFLLMILTECISYALITNRLPDTETSLILRLIGIPGRSSGALVNYPILPWLSMVLLGLLIGRLITAERLPPKALALISLACFSGFLLLRVNDLGDYNVIVENGWIGFLNSTKYPASPVYQLFTLGGIFGLLLVSQKIKPHWPTPFFSFGRSTLFFYASHLFLYGLIGFLFPRGGSWSFVFISWIIGLGIMLIMCKKWTALKQRYPSGHAIHYF